MVKSLPQQPQLRIWSRSLSAVDQVSDFLEMPYVRKLTDDMVHDHHVPPETCDFLEGAALAIAAISASQEVFLLGRWLSSRLFLGRIIFV